MPQRRSPAQVRADLRRAQQRQRDAVRKYNQAVRQYNADRRKAVANVNSAIGNYNQAVRKYNSARRTERARLERELQQLAARQRATTTVQVKSRASVDQLVSRFGLLEAAAEDGRVDGAWLDLSEHETANGAALLNALLDGEDVDDVLADGAVDLQVSGIGQELRDVGGELVQRWDGALFALNPANPDASRHFATSAREMLAQMLEQLAPDEAVLAADPNCPKTQRGSVSRRARVYYCLSLHGDGSEELVNFVESDVDNVVQLFDDFNAGTHGRAGRFPLAQLVALKGRVEDAVRFVHALALGRPI